MTKKHEAQNIAIETLNEVIEMPASTLLIAATNDHLPEGHRVLERTIDGLNIVAECFKDNRDIKTKEVRVMVSVSGYSFISNLFPVTRPTIITCA